MDPTNHPIKQYIDLLQSSADASYVRTIILKALSDPHVFTGFSELRSLPSVQKLDNAAVGAPTTAGTSQNSLLNTLDLFSYGTYRDYSTSAEDTYVKLNNSQLLKLKALSVISVIHQHCEKNNGKTNVKNGKDETAESQRTKRRNQRLQKKREEKEDMDVVEEKEDEMALSNILCSVIPYSILQSEVGLASSTSKNDDSNGGSNSNKNFEKIRKLEDLLIHCIYSNILPSGTKLDQKNMRLVMKLSPTSGSSSASLAPSSSAQTTSSTSQYETCTDVLSRDIKIDTDISEMINKLEEFYQTGKNVRAKLQTNVDALKAKAIHEVEQWGGFDQKILQAQENYRKEMSSGSRFDSEYEAKMEWMRGGGTGIAGSARQLKRSRSAKKYGK